MSQLCPIDLSRVHMDPACWPRHALSRPWVRHLTEIFRHVDDDAVEPIVVAELDAQGRHLLIDGWYRVTAARQAGCTSLPARIVPVTSAQAAFEMAVQLAAKGRQPMTWAEKRDAVDRLLSADLDRSDRQIAEIAGVSHPFVARRRTRSEASEPTAPDLKAPSGADRHARTLLKASRALRSAPGGASLSDETAVQALAAIALEAYGDGAEEHLACLEAWARRARECLSHSPRKKEVPPRVVTLPPFPERTVPPLPGRSASSAGPLCLPA